MSAEPDIFEDLRRVGALKRDLLDRQPSDNALGGHSDVQVKRDTVGAWLRGKHFPQQVEPLLAVLEQIRAEAARRGFLDAQVDSALGCTVAELLAPDRWRASWNEEQQRRVQSNKGAAERQRARAALENEARRFRQAALADRPRPMGSWSAQRLGVHPAILGHPPGAGRDRFVLPRYVPRPHDTELRERLTAAVADGAHPQLVVVRGKSCTGKTRTAFEAVHAAVPAEFDLLFPADADGLLAVLAADALGPRTVLWLNEAQHYLGGPQGEAVSAALLRRLDADGPLIVVVTLWPDHDKAFTGPPALGTEDRHSKARQLLSQAHYTTVPDFFTEHLDAVHKVARNDPSLAAAVKAGGTDLTQILAAGPDLVDHYEHPVGEHGVYGRAVITAAMDAYRLDVVSPLPLDFLEEAAPGYLTDAERANAVPTWFAGALSYARTLLKDVIRPLPDVARSTGMGALPGVVGLADFLQQYGRQTRNTQCPPTSFWDAAVLHLTDSTDLARLAYAAKARCRYRHAARLYCAAADAGQVSALIDLARIRVQLDDQENWTAIEPLYRRAADAENAKALLILARKQHETGDWEEAERLYRRAADAGDTLSLVYLAQEKEQAGDWEEAERLYRRAADAGDTLSLAYLAWVRDQAGDWEEAEQLVLQSARGGDYKAVMLLVNKREATGDAAGAERLFLQIDDTKKALNSQFADQMIRDLEANPYPFEARWIFGRTFNAGQQAGEQAALEIMDAGWNNVLAELAFVRQESPLPYVRYGLEANGALAQPWEWPMPRFL